FSCNIPAKPPSARGCQPEERSDEGSAPQMLDGREQILRGACPERSRRAQDDRAGRAKAQDDNARCADAYPPGPLGVGNPFEPTGFSAVGGSPEANVGADTPVTFAPFRGAEYPPYAGFRGS